MRLVDVVDALGVAPESVRGPLGVEIDDVSYDSRSARAGSLFCCLPGGRADGHDFASDAVAAGCPALVVERLLDLRADHEISQVIVPDARVAMAQASDLVWGHPSRMMDVVGVTGTNGKTTTTHILHHILERAGRRSGVLGTLSGARTTPEAPDLQRWLADRRDAGVTAVAMEVSSHALSLHRVDATRFAVAVFTNLSLDHLDFHGTMSAYFDAKARLFTPELSASAVVNIDDPHGRLLRDAALIDTIGYSIDEAQGMAVTATGTSFRWRGQDIHLGLGGSFNVSNALAAATAASVLGITDAEIATGLNEPIIVPGRFEVIDEGQDFQVVVDYAHTPDALDQVLRAGSEIAGSNRVLVVFGCGGDRDESKRPVMGDTAARGADAVVLTADNSRREDTAAIIDAVRAGYERAQDPRATDLRVEPDRVRAIGEALDLARPGDVVVIAGRGHETSQTIGDDTFALDDREVARAHLRSRVAS